MINEKFIIKYKMKKLVVGSIFLVLSFSTFSVTTFNFTNQLVVIYKVLNPLIVEVEQTEKMQVPSSADTFRYSETVASRKKIGITVKAPYNERDLILDKIYGTAKLELENNGEFELVEIKDSEKRIGGRGFFISEGKESSSLILPLFNASVQNRYEQRAELDAIFNEKKEKMLMGTYKGVLKLNVTYGE